MEATEAWFGSLKAVVESTARLAARVHPGESTRLDPAPPLSAAVVKQALRELPDSVRYLSSRRTEPFGAVDSEADVQDLVYLTLRPIVVDLRYETPTDQHSAGYSIADFRIDALSMLIEIKYIREKADVRRVGREIAEDIWQYSTTTSCREIVFLVYDPRLHIGNRAQFVAGASAQSGSHIVAGRDIVIDTIVVPS